MGRFMAINHTEICVCEAGVDEDTCSCCHKMKKRSEKEYKDLLNRLSRIEGQVRGIKNMLEKDAYCTDILIQVSAIQSALNGFTTKLLSNHIKTCVVQEIKDGNEENVIAELCDTIKKML